MSRILPTESVDWGKTVVGRIDWLIVHIFLREVRISTGGKVYLEWDLRVLVQLYEVTGQSDKAAEWKQKLEEFDQSAPATNSAVETKPK